MSTTQVETWAGADLRFERESDRGGRWERPSRSRPGKLEALGLVPDELIEINPRLVEDHDPRLKPKEVPASHGRT